jgi:two-component system response regulator AtoC
MLDLHSTERPMLALSHGRGGDPPADCPGTSRVLVADRSLTSKHSILEAIAASGATAERIRALPSLDALCSEPCCAALVAAGQSLEEGGTSLQLIERLHQSGCAVIGYEDGAGGWPLARRCRFLLAGCSCLLDSASEAFPIELRRAIERSIRHAEAAWALDRQLQEAMAAHGLVGRSRAILGVFATILKFSALSDLPTLITGESGTGKELLARAIHARDPKRRAGPFIALNCSTIPATLAETELFGHRRGSFTGADRDRKGLFRAAHGGVMFLDEIAELGTSVQAKLLRVLQDGRVTAIGDEHDAPVNVRVIAATNGNLRGMIADHTFRADLFHRLNVLSVHVPPVRERRADIQPLVELFARRHRALNPAAAGAIDAEFVEALGRLELPGNARQIENLVCSALVHNDGTAALGLADLPSDVWQQLADEAPARAPLPVPAEEPLTLLEANGWSLSRTLEACECSFVQAALRVSNGNQAKTARLLGITPRSVYNKLRRYHLF